MSDAHDVERCDFCKRGRVTRLNQRITFRQWTDKGYVFCRAKSPSGSASNAGQGIGTRTQRRSLKRSFGESTTSFASTILADLFTPLLVANPFSAMRALSRR